MFADEIKKQANGLGISENSSIIENLYLDSMLNMLFLEVSATAAGAGGNNRMLLRRMLMKEGSDMFAKNKFTHAAGQGLSRLSGDSSIHCVNLSQIRVKVNQTDQRC